jgi:hypothetical protein
MRPVRNPLALDMGRFKVYAAELRIPQGIATLQ